MLRVCNSHGAVQALSSLGIRDQGLGFRVYGLGFRVDSCLADRFERAYSGLWFTGSEHNRLLYFDRA